VLVADQKRWFKLWCSAPSDDGLQAITPARRWAWAAFGCYTKLHGTKGRVTVSATNTTLAAEMGVPVEALLDTIKDLPNVVVEAPRANIKGTTGQHQMEASGGNGKLTVTWKNWRKYQDDSTAAARQAAHGLRGEEKRREKEEKRDVGDKPRRAVLSDDAFIAALRPNYPGIDIDIELGKMRAKLLTPRFKGRQLTQAFVVNWLNRCDRPITTTSPSSPPAPRYRNPNHFRGCICERCKGAVDNKPE